MGDLESVGDISVEGYVDGNITCRALTLRGQPAITGDVRADSVHVCGRFDGTLRAKKVVLTKTARMTGIIYYEVLVFSEGAEFEGEIRRTSLSPPKSVTSTGAEAANVAAAEIGALAGAV